MLWSCCPGEELTEREEKLIEKRLTSNVYSTDGVAAGAIIDRNGKVYGVGNYSWAVSFMEEHQEEVLAAGGRCCWYVMNKNVWQVRAGPLHSGQVPE